MKHFSLSILLASVCVGFGIGFGLAWNIPTPDYFPQNAATVSQPQMPSAQQPVGMSQFGSVWNGNLPGESSRMPSADQGGSGDNEENLRTLAQSDPAALRNLIQRFDSERDHHAKDMLKSVLGSIHKPEVVALSARLTRSSDVAKRKEGFELLQQLPANAPEIRNVVKQALATEQSPEVLVQALAALKPAVVAPTESDAIISQLRTLSENADPTVRSQSLLQLAQWDKNERSMSSLSQGLSDPAAEVRQAAILAVTQSGVRSDSVKTALMGIINNARENREIKETALQALAHFALNQEEYASYSQARARGGL